MTSILRSLLGTATPRRSFGMDAWLELFTFGGAAYSPYNLTQTLTGSEETIDGSYGGYVRGAYQRNGIVFACEVARLSLFAEARFLFQRMRDGRPGELYSSPQLGVLERPWPSGVTGDLLARLLVNADLAGTGFAVRTREEPDRIRIPRPDWMTIVWGSRTRDRSEDLALDAEVVGFMYHPGGRHANNTPKVLLADEVAVFVPTPDPLAHVRGMSWLTPVIRETMSDSAATSFKQRFFEQGATANLVVKLDKDIALQAFGDWVEKFRESEPTGLDKAYKTLYLGGGADVTVVGGNLSQIDFKNVQGAGETRIAAAAGTPPVIVGLSEGLAGSSLNAGNYNAARRRFVDLTIRPAWRNVSGSLQVIIPPPDPDRLWYDDRDIPFLREDAGDRADIASKQAMTIRQLVDAGYEPESVVSAVEAEDWTLLEHTGLYSVQLQPPGATTTEPEPPEPDEEPDEEAETP